MAASLAFSRAGADKAEMAENVLTLVAAQDDLDAAAILATATLCDLGASVASAIVLAPAIACDIPFSGIESATGERAVRAALGARAVDCVAQATTGRRKRLLVADLESTIIENEMLEELAAYVGLREQVAEVTRRAMNGELDFLAALGERVALLEGLPALVLEEARGGIRLSRGARALVATMRKAGARTALVTGGFGVFARPVRASLGFDDLFTNELDIANGQLTGKVREPILGRDAKRHALERLAAEAAIGMRDTLAVGDGANDLPMIEVAGLGIAFHGRPAVAAQAAHRIDHCDLTALLYIQGFRADEIAPDT